MTQRITIKVRNSQEMNMQITRRDLYNRVWSTPMVRLAKELGISDVGLK